MGSTASRPGLGGGARRGGPPGECPGTAEAPALALAHPAPDAELLAVAQRVLQAVLAHHAAAAHLLGLPGRGAPLREEEIGIDAQAVGVVLPAAVVALGLRRVGSHGG